MTITLKDLHARVDDVHILQGINVTFSTGKVHALMGQNGSGKSTLANVIMGNPLYNVSGVILSDAIDITHMSPDERARLGVFLAFQYPIEVPGLTVGRFLKRAYDTLYPQSLRGRNFITLLRSLMDVLEMDHSFINRYLNDGFSGGEKKKMEILQLMILQPHLAILDETDSGLDIDALKIVAKGINHLRKKKAMTILIITHYQRILSYIKPNFVHIMHKGTIITSGDASLASILEEKGYEWLRKQYVDKEDS